MALSSLTGKKLLAALLTICLFQTVTQAAQFTNSFDNVRSGSSLLLTWEGVKREHYPLYITAQVIQERESEGGRIRADAWRMNITGVFFRPLKITSWKGHGGGSWFARSIKVEGANLDKTIAGMTESSYEWTSVPYPLRWIPSGLYQLELWSMRWTEEDQLPPLLAQSSVFRISESETGNGQSTGQSSVSLPWTDVAGLWGFDMSSKQTVPTWAIIKAIVSPS